MADEPHEVTAGKPVVTATQGEAVKKAIEGDRNEDVDRWGGASRGEVKAMAQDPASPEGADKPRAGLSRDGGVVEGCAENPHPPTR